MFSVSRCDGVKFLNAWEVFTLGVLPIMAYTGRLRPKGVLFSGLRYFFFFPHHYPLALALNKSPAVFFLSRALDGLWRENRESVNRLERPGISLVEVYTQMGREIPRGVFITVRNLLALKAVKWVSNRPLRILQVFQRLENNKEEGICFKLFFEKFYESIENQSSWETFLSFNFSDRS